MSPQSTHFHQKLATNTDQKFSPDDKGLYAAQKSALVEDVEDAEEEFLEHQPESPALHGVAPDEDKD